MFAPGCGPEYRRIVDDALKNGMDFADMAGDMPGRFDFAVALILPALRAHLEQQSNICVVIR